MELWEILVPTFMNGHPCRTRHHKEWDKLVRKISGGLTLLKPAKGQWINQEDGQLHEERVIPVRISCSKKNIQTIIEFTSRHYNQIMVMAYRVSDDVLFFKNPNFKKF